MKCFFEQNESINFLIGRYWKVVTQPSPRYHGPWALGLRSNLLRSQRWNKRGLTLRLGKIPMVCGFPMCPTVMISAGGAMAQVRCIKPNPEKAPGTAPGHQLVPSDSRFYPPRVCFLRFLGNISNFLCSWCLPSSYSSRSWLNKFWQSWWKSWCWLPSKVTEPYHWYHRTWSRRSSWLPSWCFSGDSSNHDWSVGSTLSCPYAFRISLLNLTNVQWQVIQSWSMLNHIELPTMKISILNISWR